ncbi:hypothetical protein [Alicycliphilus denitrificans]|jgi:hypothetical protein|uniref:hypothetical protein n=1 Tax=Alicycliphilus denitrificans TaxID=179636 RepID=UPI002C1B77EB|nr:hypothetical protein [Alicycliphilus sp.]
MALGAVFKVLGVGRGQASPRHSANTDSAPCPRCARRAQALAATGAGGSMAAGGAVVQAEMARHAPSAHRRHRASGVARFMA